jgi:hypothetical protein
MKRALLSFVLVFAAFALYAQCGGGDCGSYQHGDRTNYGTQGTVSSAAKPDVDFMLYPNPTVDFIQIDDKSVDAGLAKYMRIYSLTGQMVKSFSIAKGNNYNVSDLKAGTYLVQFVNWKKKVITTKRINKSEGL